MLWKTPLINMLKNLVERVIKLSVMISIHSPIQEVLEYMHQFFKHKCSIGSVLQVANDTITRFL